MATSKDTPGSKSTRKVARRRSAPKSAATRPDAQDIAAPEAATPESGAAASSPARKIITREGRNRKGDADVAPVEVDTTHGTPNPLAMNLALQGGGAHGAFTWGVLDWILEYEPVRIDGISGTSAGAMNAVALASGYHKGGAEGAREALDAYWKAVSRAARSSPVQRTVIDRMMGNWSLDWSPGYMMVDVISRFISPYEFNPLNLNPLKDLIEGIVDFDDVRACTSLRLFLSATNVRTGKVKVFRNADITSDAVMASACLPLMFQAVEIDGVPYWDGGFSGNPALWPFFYETKTEDLLLIQINPIERPETPRTAREILNRMNEITFNSSLIKELRAIEFVDRLVRTEALDRDKYKQIRVHVIDGGEFLNDLTASSKFNAEWGFLTHLRDAGREAAQRFHDAYATHIGVKETANIRKIID